MSSIPPSMQDYGPLCGRSQELARLVESWRKVTSGHGPILEVVLAEPGMGKTRLVQELYASIAAQQPPQSGAQYWPARLGRERVNLLLNPPMDQIDDDADPTFLWWGMRLANPHERNATASGAVGTYRPFITPHLHALMRERRRTMLRTRLAVQAARLVANFSVVGQAVEVGTMAQEIRGTARALVQERSASLDWRETQEREDINKSVVDQLVELFRKRVNTTPLPIAWVIDDAQFGLHDPGAVSLFESMLDAAIGQIWPLLIVVTHWQREWNLQKHAAEGKTFAAATERIYRPYHRGWQPIALGPIPAQALEPMLRAGLPGLTVEQRNRLLERVGGQAGVLDELITVCRGRPRYFVDGDPRAAFRASELHKVLALPTRLQELAEERLQDLPDDVSRLASLASTQGIRFAHALNRKLATALGFDAAEIEQILDDDVHARGHHPYAVFVPITAGAGEVRSHGTAFAQHTLFEAARERLTDHFDLDPREVDAAWRGVLMEALREEVDDARREFVTELAATKLTGSPNAEERLVGATAIVALIDLARARHDVHTAAYLAANVWRGTSDGSWDAADLGTATLTILYAAVRGTAHAVLAPEIAEALLRVAASPHDRFEALGKLGDACNDLGDRQRALAMHHEAFAWARAEAAAQPEGAWAKELGWAHYRLGLHAHAVREHGEAIGHFTAALGSLRARHERDDAAIALQDVARVLTMLAREHENVGDLEQASRYAEEALRANHDLAANHPTPAHDRGLSIALGKVGDVHLKIPNVEKALQYYQEAHEIAKRAFRQHPTPEHERGLAISCGRIGDAYLQKGEASTALRYFEESHTFSVALAAALRTDPFREGPGFSWDRLGRAYRALHRTREAFDAFHRAATVWHGLQHPNPVEKYRVFAQASIAAARQVHTALSESEREATRATLDGLQAIQEALGVPAS